VYEESLVLPRMTSITQYGRCEVESSVLALVDRDDPANLFTGSWEVRQR